AGWADRKLNQPLKPSNKNDRLHETSKQVTEVSKMLQAAPSELAPFAAAYDRIADRTIEPGRLARALARVGARPLDRKLSAGADPAGSTMLAARACRLTSYAH